MRCELYLVKHLQEHTYSFLRVELSQLLGEKENLSYGNGGIRTCNLQISSRML